MLHLPFRKGLVVGQVAVDPRGHHGHALGVDHGGADRGHADAAPRVGAQVDRRVGGVARPHHPVAGVAQVVDQGSVDEARVGQRPDQARVEGGRHGAAREMALRAIDLQVDAGPVLEADRAVGEGGVGGQHVRGRQGAVEIADGGQPGQLVGGVAGRVGGVAVELGGVEAEGESRGGAVAGQALLAAGIAPALGVDDAALADQDVLVQALARNQRGLAE